MAPSPGTGNPSGSPELGFAPRDLTDSRGPGDWQSRYGRQAWKWILLEGLYLFLLMLAVVSATVIVWLGHPAVWWQLTPPKSAKFAVYAYAWLGGTLGGLLLSMKWLYHAVGKTMWHLDRSVWRYLTPHVSGGLAYATVAIFNSIIASEQAIVMPGTKAMAIGFLVGLFSDNAVAKLAEVAETLLGPSRRSTKSATGTGGEPGS